MTNGARAAWNELRTEEKEILKERIKKLEKRYEREERLLAIAYQNKCDGDCDLESPHQKCAECLASSALNTLSEMCGQFIDEVEQVLKGK